ncbi:2-hydroxymuconate tautomerase [Thiolapillus sp.]
MPFAQITMIEGRTKEQKAALIKEVTEAIHNSIGAPRENIRVALYEVSKADWGIGGETMEKLRP